MKKFLTIILLFNILSLFFSPIINLKANNNGTEKQKSNITLKVTNTFMNTNNYQFEEQNSEGAGFALLNLKDNSEIILNSDKDGNINFENIGIGEYVLRELGNNYNYGSDGIIVKVNINEENIGKTIDLGKFTNLNSRVFDGTGEAYINYIDKETGNSIVSQAIIRKYIRSNYSAQKLEFKNYNFDSSLGEIEGSFYGKDFVNIIFYYTKKETNIVLANPDKTKIPNDKGGEIPVLNNDTFNGNTPTPDNVTVTIVGEPRIPVTVNNEGKVIIPPTTETGIFTFEYKICDKINPDNCSIAPVNVDLIPNIGANPDNPRIPNDKGGEIPVLNNDTFNGNTPTPDNVTVTIVGEPRIPVSVNDQGKVIVPPTTETGIFTFEYKICDKNNPDNCSIAPVNVDLYEEVKTTPPEIKKGKVIINFIDKENGDKISEEKIIEGNVGDKYSTEKIEISNYTFDSVLGNENGVFSENETIIKYFYNKIKEEDKKSTILVQYLDKETGNKLLEDKTYYGVVGEEYSLVKISFDGYTFNSIEGNESGVYEENQIVVKYFYTKIKTTTPPTNETPKYPGAPTPNITLEEDPRVNKPETPKETPKEEPKEPEIPLDSAPEKTFDFDPVPPMGEEPEIILPKVLPKTGAQEVIFFLLSLFSAYFIINRRLFLKK